MMKHSEHPEQLDELFQDFPPETICVNCGRRLDDESQCHEIWKEDPCYFEPNTDAKRLARIRGEVRHLLGLGMTIEEIVGAAQQTAVLLGTTLETEAPAVAKTLEAVGEAAWSFADLDAEHTISCHAESLPDAYRAACAVIDKIRALTSVDLEQIERAP